LYMKFQPYQSYSVFVKVSMFVYSSTGRGARILEVAYKLFDNLYPHLSRSIRLNIAIQVPYRPANESLLPRIRAGKEALLAR